ncbi:MAG: FAD-dependent oxidoreductase [Acidobacteriota bacterium]|nr:MAG: FAD-dependent oxidoreductase [Acidobacteriota bacterium]
MMRQETETLPRVAILGAGPAGLGAAWRLAVSGRGRPVVLEQRSEVGGNSGSFELEGINLDYGSHRLHPACEPGILADLRGLLGDDLIDRPRHGRIRLRGRWIHFPLKPLDLLLGLPFSFSAGFAVDTLRKVLPAANGDAPETFAGVLERSLGRTICRDFYFPYAVKIWGVPPEELSAIQARRRVSAGSAGRMIRKAFNSVPGLKPPGAGHFFYPRHGFGQISRAIADAAVRAGAELRLETSVRLVRPGRPHRIEVEQGGEMRTIEADYIWSTIPITVLARMLEPAAPRQLIDAAARIKYRAMALVYLVLDETRFTEFDAHYFPESDVRLTRLSEPMNYSAAESPVGRTALCGEIPCEIDDQVWRASDDELAELMLESLAKCDLPVRSKVLKVVTRRLPQAYPIYHLDYEKYFDAFDRWIASLDRVLTFGRQGLFAHDNTHHALAMAYAAVDCLDDAGNFDAEKWLTYRDQFSHHVVED